MSARRSSPASRADRRAGDPLRASAALTRRALTMAAQATRTSSPSAQTIPERLGSLTLTLTQRQAAARLLGMLARHRGGLLADGVGMGKTRVALAVASCWPSPAPTLILAPARLLPMWRRECAQADLVHGHDVFMLSHEAMSRLPERSPCPMTQGAGLILVDEAHRMRNPQARRSRHLARWAAQAPTLLVTASPICGSLWDLHALLSLFLGEDELRQVAGCDLTRAFALASQGDYDLAPLLSACVVRRSGDTHSLPRPDVELELLGYQASDAERWLWHHLEATLRAMTWPALRGQWPSGLLVEHLLRRWESGVRALRASLESLRDYSARWLHAWRRGATLARADHAALFERGSAQEVLPFVWDELPARPALDASQAPWDERDVERLAQRELEALDALLARVRGLEQEGCGRAQAIAALLEREPSTKALIFTSYEDTAEQLYALLRQRLGPRGQLGLLTGRQARVTGMGRISPQALLRRFAPRAQHAPSPSAQQRVRVLVATDCLSEGVNLQDCGCVILMDLPYSPLGVEQRVGRLVRPGGDHLRVRVILPRPTDWRDSLGMRRRLDQKLSEAQAGHAPLPLTSALLHPTKAPASVEPDPLAAMGALEQLMAQAARDPRDSRDSGDSGDLAAAPGAQEHWRVTLPKRSSAHARYAWRGMALGLFARASSAQAWWVEVDDRGSRALSASTLVPRLVSLMDDDLPATRLSEEQALAHPSVVALRAATLSRLESLQAMSQAPAPLGAQSAQVLAWEALARQAQRAPGAQRAQWAQALTRLRPRLLRPLARGLELEIVRALHDPETLLDALTALLPEPEEDQGAWQLRWWWSVVLEPA